MGAQQSHSHAAGSRTGGSSNSRLLFHSTHGDNVQISEHGTVARRASSFCKGVVFSDRPVKINEKVCLRFVEVSTNWTGVLRVGFSSNDPSNLKSCLPKYACPDLTSRSGFWAKAFSDIHVKKDSVLFYYVNAAGDVHFGINGDEKGIFFTGVDTRKPLWALIDIYGNTTALELVDERAHLNNLKKNNSNRQSTTTDVSNNIVSSLATMRISGNDSPSPSAVMEKFPEIRHYVGVVPGSLLFHRIKGRNVEMGLLRCQAGRRLNEYANGYVFTANSIQPGEGVLIQVQEHDPEFASSLAFGVTSCNPDDLEDVSLPDDSHYLLDRPEYWVVKKDAAICPVSGDELCFTMIEDGEIIMTKNGGPPASVMFVDNSIPLWMFFDIYGTTTKIFLVGKVPRSILQTDGARNRLPTSSSASNVSSLQLNLASDLADGALGSHNQRVRSSMPRSQSSILPGSAADSARSSTVSALRKIASIEQTTEPAQESKENSTVDIECVVCCERTVDSVFYTCGHMCMCYQCATEYSKPNDKRWCPICRAPIADIIRTYKS